MFGFYFEIFLWTTKMEPGSRALWKVLISETKSQEFKAGDYLLTSSFTFSLFFSCSSHTVTHHTHSSQLTHHNRGKKLAWFLLNQLPGNQHSDKDFSTGILLHKKMGSTLDIPAFKSPNLQFAGWWTLDRSRHCTLSFWLSLTASMWWMWGLNEIMEVKCLLACCSMKKFLPVVVKESFVLNMKTDIYHQVLLTWNLKNLTRHYMFSVVGAVGRTGCDYSHLYGVTLV